MSEPTKLSTKENFLQTVKYFCFAASAGAIQAGSFALLTELNVFRDADTPYGPSYLIALVLSVLWNFTLNRKFTFKSANNVPIAMLKVAAYYAVFTPLSLWWGNALTGRYPQHWVQYAVLVGTLLVNGVSEFLYQRFFVFGKSINSATKKKQDSAGSAHDA
ncbi:MAG: GtrA family protein [Oscillospiraceae bacterium]|nr:GtrA family protein [Oscillospiraceae bacterium]